MDVSPVMVDWLTSVSPVARHGHWLRRFLDREATKPTHRGYHHTHAVEYYPSQIKHYFSPNIPDTGSVIVMSGQALGNIRSEHDNDWCNKVVAILARSSSHFSRIDLAVDFMDEGKLARHVAQLVLAGKLDFSPRKCTVVQGAGEKGGTTVYVGSRTSPLYLRLYDKYIESGGLIPSSRLEFECKAEYAALISEDLAQFAGWTHITALFNGLLWKFPALGSIPEIEALRFGDVRTVEPSKRIRLQDTKTWLTRQVMPTFIKDPDGEGGELWEWFAAEIIKANSKRT